MAKEIKQDGSVVLTSKNAGFEFDPKCTSFQISGSCRVMKKATRYAGCM